MTEHVHHHSPQLADLVPSLELPATPACAVDVGCGGGDDVRWLHAAGFDAIGVDVDTEAIASAAARTPPAAGITWLAGSATSVPVPDDSCVLVTDRGCLHHLPVGDRGAYAREVERVLVAGGAWLIRDVVGHHHQVAELDAAAIEDLASGAALRVERCDFVEAAGAHVHTWLVAVLRRD